MAGLGTRFREMNPRDRRAVTIGGVAIVVVVLAAVILKVAGGGGGAAGNSGVASSPSPISTPAQPRPGAPGVTTPRSAGGSVPPSFSVYSQKDPFQAPPGYAVSGGPAGSGGGSTSGSGQSSATTSGGTSGGGTSGGGTSGGTSGGGTSGGTTSGGGGGATGTTTTTSPGASGATSGGGSTAPTRGQSVQLLDVYANGSQTDASVQVDDQVYTVSPGQSFAGNYTVIDLSLASGCGDFSHGGVQFHMCKGQTVLK